MNLTQLVLTALACSFLLIGAVLATSALISAAGVISAFILFFFLSVLLLANLNSIGDECVDTFPDLLGKLYRYMCNIIGRLRL